MKKCRHYWMENFVDRKSYQQGYVWRCYDCGRVRKTTPDELKKVDMNAHLRGLISI